MQLFDLTKHGAASAGTEPKPRIRFLPREKINAINNPDKLKRLRDTYLQIVADIALDIAVVATLPTEPEWLDRANNARNGYWQAARFVQRRLLELGAADWELPTNSSSTNIIQQLLAYNGRLQEEVEALSCWLEGLVGLYLTVRIYNLPQNDPGIISDMETEIERLQQTVAAVKEGRTETNKTITDLKAEIQRLKASNEKLMAVNDGLRTANIHLSTAVKRRGDEIAALKLR